MAFPEVGDTLDIFTIISKLHDGALTTIFLAEDQLTREEVVLKIPCGDILNKPIILYHYQNEERISRRIEHPGIVRFIHRHRSRQYLIMEKLSGKDLRAEVGTNHILELHDALVLMKQLCEIVGYLHKQSIVHLDLKPENILRLNNSTIKLIDFGLASCASLPDLLTLDFQNPQGTPWYIAPEQLLGERADPRCDIYSMGMILYEMFTGKLPWPRSSKLNTARRRLRHDPIPPRYYQPDIPPQIQSIILRALCRHPSDRYSSVPDLQYDLNYWRQLPVTPQGTNSRKPSIWKRIFPGKPVQLNSSRYQKTKLLKRKPQIVGALIDSSTSHDMLMEVRKQALIHSAEITLVHVIQEESDPHTTHYGITVEGEELMAEFERSVQNLRRFSIDPSIRIIRGDLIDVLEGLCRTLEADLLVLGTSRKEKSLLRGASVRRRLERRKNFLSKVTVAEQELFSPVTDLRNLQPESLTEQQVLSCDIFLVDLWFEQLHLHTEFIYKLLLQQEQKNDSYVDNCRLGQFLESLEKSECWNHIWSILDLIHRQFHSITTKMSKVSPSDHTALQNIYTLESLPLACTFKKSLGQVSRILRARLEEKPPPVPFLVDTSCPVTMPYLACYGPLLRALTLDRDLCVLIEKNCTRLSNSGLSGVH